MLTFLHVKSKFTFLFVLAILSIIVPSLIPHETYFQFAFMIIFSSLVVAGAQAVSLSPRHRKFAILSAICTLFVSWAMYFNILGSFFSMISHIPFLFFFMYIVYYLIFSILQSKDVTPDVILGAITGYILLGYTGAIYFLVITDFYPNSFSHAEGQNLDMIYFSFVTLTTLGYGDITPHSNAAQGGAILLTIFGQFYIAVIVALLVSKYLHTRVNSSAK